MVSMYKKRISFRFPGTSNRSESCRTSLYFSGKWFPIRKIVPTFWMPFLDINSRIWLGKFELDFYLIPFVLDEAYELRMSNEIASLTRPTGWGRLSEGINTLDRLGQKPGGLGTSSPSLAGGSEVSVYAESRPRPFFSYLYSSSLFLVVYYVH